MPMSKGYGDPRGPGMGRGAFSEKKNMASVPKKGSSLHMQSPVQGQDAKMVDKMAKKQYANEDLRGRPS